MLVVGMVMAHGYHAEAGLLLLLLELALVVCHQPRLPRLRNLDTSQLKHSCFK